MSDAICLLITLLYDKDLMRCALKIKSSDLDRLPYATKWLFREQDDEVEDGLDELYENERREFLHSKLPLHVRTLGPIVEIQQIFEVTELY